MIFIYQIWKTQKQKKESESRRTESVMNKRKKSITDQKSFLRSIAMKILPSNNDRTLLLDEKKEIGYGTMNSKC